jgi:hypothetical protein
MPSEASSPAASTVTQDPIATATSGSGAPALPGNSSLAKEPGGLVKLPENADGKPKDPSLQISVKLDIAVEVHLSARIRGDIVIGLL